MPPSDHHVFGSSELTPDLVRQAQFDEVDGRYEARQVRAFLDRVAASLEVFLSSDAAQALRAEFARNADIAQQVLDAGTTASAQLREQAEREAAALRADTERYVNEQRSGVAAELQQSHAQVESMRAQLIQDLRDLYDRIGASLYRFERADSEGSSAPIREPEQSAAPAFTAPLQADDVSPATADLDTHVNNDAEPSAELRPPAWQQLPPEAYAPAPADGFDATDVDAPNLDPTAPFAVTEDEPLAPGEPLIDLRDLGSDAPADAPAPTLPTEDSSPLGAMHSDEELAQVPDATTMTDTQLPTTSGASWLDGGDTPAAPQPDAATSDQAGASESTDAFGDSWLDPSPPAPPDPASARDDALAQALLGGTDAANDAASEPPVSDSAPAAPPFDDGDANDIAPAAPVVDASLGPQPAATASPDAAAVRQLIIEALAAGQPRDTVESFLRDHMGFVEPGALVDAALNPAPGAPESQQ